MGFTVATDGATVALTGGATALGVAVASVYVASVDASGIGAWTSAGELAEASTFGSAMTVEHAFVRIGGTPNFKQGRKATLMSELATWAPTDGAELDEGLVSAGLVHVGDSLVVIGGVAGSSGTTDAVWVASACE